MRRRPATRGGSPGDSPIFDISPSEEAGLSAAEPVNEFPGDQVVDFYIGRRYIIEYDDPTYFTPGGPPEGGPEAPCITEVGAHATPQGGTFDVLGKSGDWEYCGWMSIETTGVTHQRPAPDNILWVEPIEWGERTYFTYAGVADNFDAEPLSGPIGPYQFGITIVPYRPADINFSDLGTPSESAESMSAMSAVAMLPPGGNFVWLVRFFPEAYLVPQWALTRPVFQPMTIVLWKRGPGKGRATARLTVENDCDYFGEDPIGPTPTPVQPCGDM